MRVVAGIYGSRPLKSCKGDATRPTADKVKGAIFSSLGMQGTKGRMLDCYSGTGNMAIEALSRGMEHATMVDKDPQAVRIIKENVRNLKIKNCDIHQGSIFSILPKLSLPYDLVFMDPPYAKEQNVELMEKLEEYHLINEGGMVVIESLKEQTFPEQVFSLVKIKEKIYGITKITYYRKETL